MVKRKTLGNDATVANGKLPEKTAAADDSSDEDDVDMLDVEFEWFDPQEIDFHGLKLLLRQLFDVDHEMFDLSGLSNLIVSQPLLGSTVKVPEDGVETNQTDPFAFLTVLNLQTHGAKPELKPLLTYLSQKATTTPSLSSLPALLSPSSPAQVGLILTERFINVPPEIVPPMYKMLLEEIQWAVQDNEPYNFTHYLILSKTYTEIDSQLPSSSSQDMEIDDAAPAQKKSRKATGSAGPPAAEVFYFHAEDEVLQKYALGYGDYAYSKPYAEGASDAKRAFQEAGIKPTGRMILVEAAKFEEAVKAVEQYISPTA